MSNGNSKRAESALNAFRRIFRELRLAATRTQNTSGLSAAQLFLLDKVESSPSSSFTELASRTLTDRTSVAAAIKRLSEKKLVTMTPSPLDRRKTVISITTAGRSILKKAPQTPADELLAALTSMKNVELRRLTRSLELLVSTMGISESPAPFLFDDSDTAVGRNNSMPRNSGRRAH